MGTSAPCEHSRQRDGRRQASSGHGETTAHMLDYPAFRTDG